MENKEDKKVGRPTKFDSIDIELVKKLYENGLTDQQVAGILGINKDTIYEWKKKHPDFSDSIKGWKEFADEKVERSLFERATGYSHPDVHITNYQGSIKETDIIKVYPPDPTSMIFWLKNRKPEQWRDRQEHSFEGIDELLAKIRNKDG